MKPFVFSWVGRETLVVDTTRKRIVCRCDRSDDAELIARLLCEQAALRERDAVAAIAYMAPEAIAATFGSPVSPE